jgi:hypothetical protein
MTGLFDRSTEAPSASLLETAAREKHVALEGVQALALDDTGQYVGHGRPVAAEGSGIRDNPGVERMPS